MRSSVAKPQHPYESLPPRRVANTTRLPKTTEKTILPLFGEEWFPFVLLAVATYGVVYALIAADWVSHSMVLLCSPLLGLLVGLLVARIPQLPQSILHLGACLVGHWFSIWLTSVIAFHVSWLLLLGSLRAIIGGLGTTAMIPNSEIVFFFYLSFLSFFLGYFGSWLIYRAHLPWLVALVYCSILLVNLNYMQQDMLYLVMIVLGALLLLIARGQLTNQVGQWMKEGMYAEPSWLSSMCWRSMRIAAVLTLLALLLSWLLPMQAQSDAGKTFWNRLDTAWTNMLDGHVSVQNPATLTQPYQVPSIFFSDQLTITGSVHLPTGEVLSYKSSAGPRYLEGFTYNRFDGHTWTSTLAAGNGQAVDANTILPPDIAKSSNQRVTTTVTVVQPPETVKHYIFAPAQPTLFDVATIVYNDGTAATWTQQNSLVAGEHYQVISTVPPSDVQSLSGIPLPQNKSGFWQADDIYHKLSGSYTEVPHDLSAQVWSLTRQWTSGATDTYSALKMLEAHLSDDHVFTYSLDNQPIPNNVDVVDWLLQTHTGYCTYYASAMTVMARLLGIPTRIVSGFSPGHLKGDQGMWAVDGTDAHSWVQAYLPGRGWINFDPTPGFAPHPAPAQSGPVPVATKSPVIPSATPASPSKVHPPPSSQQHSVHPSSHGTFPGSKNLLEVLSMLLLLSSLLVLLAAVVTYWWRSLYANSTLIAGMYWRLCRVASWLGISPRSSQTPYEYSSILSRYCPQWSVPLWQLTRFFVRERWGAPQQASHPIELEATERLWPALRRMLLQLAIKRIIKRYAIIRR